METTANPYQSSHSLADVESSKPRFKWTSKRLVALAVLLFLMGYGGSFFYACVSLKLREIWVNKRTEKFVRELKVNPNTPNPWEEDLRRELSQHE